MLCLAFSAGASAQYYTLGTDPASTRWSIIKGDNFRVIYPRGLDSLAREFLYQFELARPRTQVALKIEGSEMPLILHPYNVNSNATVVWAPRRVDIFTTPPSNRGYADTWVRQLALHEGRHVGQCTHFTTGTFAVFKYLLGEQGVGLGMGFYPTGWELEGDAVHSETDFSKAGRGRDPNFLMPFRAKFLSGDDHIYDTYRFNSYRNYIPSKYSFGYIVETFMRDNSDYYVVGDIYHDYTRWWYDPSILNKAYQKYTGKTRRKNFRGAQAYFTEKWRGEFIENAPYTVHQDLSNFNDGYYALYHSVLPMDGFTVAAKNAMTQAPRLVKIDPDGNERYIRAFADKSLTSAIIKKDDHTLVWSEIVPHPRWELKSWSVIRSYDLKTHRMRTLTHRTRWFNPAYSPQGDKMLVTEYALDGTSQVVLLDADSMAEVARIAAPEGGQIHYTAWVGNRIYADAITGDGQWGLYSRPVGDSFAPWRVEIAPQTRSIMRLQRAGNRLIFETDLDGIGNIYSFNPATHRAQKLTHAPFGASYPHFDQEEGALYYSDYSVRGDLPAKTARADLLWEDADFDKPYLFAEADRFSAESDTMAPALPPEAAAALRAKVDSLPAKRYHKPLHWLNFHSYAPFYAGVNRIMNMSYDYIYQLVAPGVTAVAQSPLGDAVVIAGYSYHDHHHAGHFNFNYNGLWPIFEISADFNERDRCRFDYSEYSRSDTKIDTLALGTPSLELSGKIYTNINLSRGGWKSSIIPSVELHWTNDEYSSGCDVIGGGSIEAGVRWSSVIPRPRSAIMPRLGLGMEVKGACVVGPDTGIARSLYGYAYGYVPGFTQLQGFKFTASGQKRFDDWSAAAAARTLAKMPRGYKSMPLGDYYKLTAEYAIPINLNDWAPAPILFYLMRINVVPFVDYAVNRGPAGVQQMASYGTVLTFQGHYFRLGPELNIGGRFSRYLDFDGRWRFRAEFVTSLGL